MTPGYRLCVMWYCLIELSNEIIKNINVQITMDILYMSLIKFI